VDISGFIPDPIEAVMAWLLFFGALATAGGILWNFGPFEWARAHVAKDRAARIAAELSPMVDQKVESAAAATREAYDALTLQVQSVHRVAVDGELSVGELRTHLEEQRQADEVARVRRQTEWDAAQRAQDVEVADVKGRVGALEEQVTAIDAKVTTTVRLARAVAKVTNARAADMLDDDEIITRDHDEAARG
jgi:hypothetical protein